MSAAVGANYASPVTVNGYPCWNCTDVEKAKKSVDPSARSDTTGPVDRSTQPTVRGAESAPDDVGSRPTVSAHDRAAGLGRLIDRLV